MILGLFFTTTLDAKKDTENQIPNFKGSQKILKKTLADHGVLLFQTLNYHWNLEGQEFHDYHLLFEKQYKQLFNNLDLIAERIRSIGGKALGSMYDFIAYSSLKEDTKQTPEPKQMIINLLDQYKILIENIRSSIKFLERKSKDFGTRKMLEDLLEQHEKTAWMLRSVRSK
jgi:starvation-inducible DNA-binding protein